MKWWKKVFFHLFTLSILDSHNLYKERKSLQSRTGQTQRVQNTHRDGGVPTLSVSVSWFAPDFPGLEERGIWGTR